MVPHCERMFHVEQTAGCSGGWRVLTLGHSRCSTWNTAMREWGGAGYGLLSCTVRACADVGCRDQIMGGLLRRLEGFRPKERWCAPPG